MTKHNIPDPQRLLLYIADAGGSMILTSTHRAFGGRASAARISRAVADLGDLIALEKIHAAGSGRPATRLSLTLKGCAAVQYLRPGFEPRRLSVPVLQHWLEELKAEHNPWAMTLIENEQDAQYWRSEKAARKAKRDKIQKKIDDAIAAEPKRPSACRNRSEQDLEARGEWAASKGFQPKDDMASDESLNEPAYPTPDLPPLNATPPRPSRTVLRAGSYCERCHFNRELCTCAHPLPARIYTPTIRAHDSGISDGPTGDSSERIKEKARRLGYGAAIMRDGMLYDSKKISFEDWDAKVPG